MRVPASTHYSMRIRVIEEIPYYVFLRFDDKAVMYEPPKNLGLHRLHVDPDFAEVMVVVSCASGEQITLHDYKLGDFSVFGIALSGYIPLDHEGTTYRHTSWYLVQALPADEIIKRIESTNHRKITAAGTAVPIVPGLTDEKAPQIGSKSSEANRSCV